MFTWITGITILGWIKLAVIAALMGSLMYIMIDYKSLAAQNATLHADVARLESNITELKAISDTTKQALTALDTTCSLQLRTFLEEKDILMLIEKSKDPLSDAANWAVRAEKGKEKK